MMSFLEIVVFILEIIGTVVFSISGGLVGIERGLTILVSRCCR